MNMTAGWHLWTDLLKVRRHPRKSVLWSAELILSDGEVVEATVLDISAGGARLRVQRPFCKGEAVTFASMRSEDRRAHVAWVNSERIGIKFDDWNDLVEGSGAAKVADVVGQSSFDTSSGQS